MNASLIQQLGRVDYVTQDFEIERIPDEILNLTEGLDYETVFICGGYAAFVAGLTTEYLDIDFFCTSKLTFDILVNRLSDRADKSPTVVAGDYEEYKINVVYCSDAISAEDILDAFDMTWCRVAIDLQNPCLIMHPEADNELPIFDADRLYNPLINKSSFVNKIFNRYCKYKERRIKRCLLLDNDVYSILSNHTLNSIQQNPEKKFDNSY